MNAEGRGQLLPLRTYRDHGIPGCGANAFAEPVDQHHRGQQRPYVADQEQADSRDGREGVAGERNLLMLAGTVRHVSGDESDDGCTAEVETVDHAEGERGESEIEHEVHRKDGAYHLGGDVGEEARESEHQDRGADPGPGEPEAFSFFSPTQYLA